MYKSRMSIILLQINTHSRFLSIFRSFVVHLWKCGVYAHLISHPSYLAVYVVSRIVSRSVTQNYEVSDYICIKRSFHEAAVTKI